MPEDWNAPRQGQAAAIVQSARGAYLARFPYAAAGGREKAHEAAHAWKNANAPTATVRGFTGQVQLIWEP